MTAEEVKPKRELHAIEQRLDSLTDHPDVSGDTEAYVAEAITAVSAAVVAVGDTEEA